MKKIVLIESSDDDKIVDKVESMLTSLDEDDNISVIDTDSVTIGKEDVLIFKYSIDLDMEEVEQIRRIINIEFPNNKVLGLCDDIKLLEQNPKEAIDMLSKMIAHIKIVSP